MTETHIGILLHARSRVAGSIIRFCGGKKGTTPSPAHPPLRSILEKLPLSRIVIAVAELQLAVDINPIVLLRMLSLPVFSSRTARQVIYNVELPGERLCLRSQVWRV